MAGPFEEAAFNAKPDTLVGPVQTQFGCHLIETLEKRAAGAEPFEQVKEMIRHRLAAERTAGMAEAKAKELARSWPTTSPKAPRS